MVAMISAYWILPPEGFAIEFLSDFVGLSFFSGMGVLMSVVAEFYRRARQQAHERSLELAKANEALRDLSAGRSYPDNVYQVRFRLLLMLTISDL